MKTVLLGATGRTEKFALQKALAKGYEVNNLVRDSTKVPPGQNLIIFWRNTFDSH